MKDIITLEINGKKETLGNIEIDTPNELLLVNSIEPILNNRIFEEFIDEIFVFVTMELADKFDDKIENIYVTFVDDSDAFICSVVLDRLKPKRGKYRMSVIDWQAQGYIFKYAEDGEA